jgi:hypothetical protein
MYRIGQETGKTVKSDTESSMQIPVKPLFSVSWLESAFLGLTQSEIKVIEQLKSENESSEPIE